MKIAIFGGTGRTGKHLVEQALEQGHEVVMLARDPAKVGLQHERLTVVQGSVMDDAAVEQVVRGADAVVSALGPASNAPTFEISQGTAKILAAMERAGARRLVISAGAGVGAPGDAPKLFNHLISFLLKVTAKNVYEDMVRTVDAVRSSKLDWTVVRVPMLTDDPRTGQVKVGMVGKGMGPRISRADMAEFMLQQVTSDAHLRQSPAISN
jgi:putative NADH-flavin reductase